MKALQQGGDDITFHFTQGPIPAPPSPEFQSFFGDPPHWRFVALEGESSIEALDRHRNFCAQEDPEETIRKSITVPDDCAVQSVKNAMHQLRNTMIEEGPFEGVIGYSEGAAIGATLLVKELQRAKKTGVPSTLKCAMFIAGAPPLRTDPPGFYLSDEAGEIISVPTCHVIGVSDPYINCALALHGVCDSDKAMLFDHGWGHTIPRDADIVKDLAITIREMIVLAEGLEAGAEELD